LIAELVTTLLRRDRAAMLLGLVAVVALAWTYLLFGAGIEMQTMDMGGGQTMVMPPQWTLGYASLTFVMWATMMVAMMLPSAAPIILLVAALSRQRSGPATASAAFFGLGYFLVWFGFCLAATALQWGLAETSLLSETMAFGNAFLGGGVLVAAGINQWTPLKDTCLRHCRSPVSFLVQKLARGRGWRSLDWRTAWCLLPRMLLDADGTTVRGWRYEPHLDRRYRTPRASREDLALGRADESHHRHRARRLWRRHSCDGDLIASADDA
jgi:predicted metal-binding membrane protein